MTLAYARIYIYFRNYLCVCIYVYLKHHEFTLTPVTLITHVKFIVASFVTSFFNSEKPGCHYLQHISLFVQPYYTSKIVSELLTLPLTRNKSTICIVESVYNPFLSSA